MMKRLNKILSLLLTIGIVINLLPAMVMPANAAGNTHTAAKGQDLRAMLLDTRVKDGDTIELDGNAIVNDTNNDAAPWIIDKAVTIKGGTLNLRAGGIILGADVTFDNVQLSFANAMRNVIMANGHTLTLHNVSRYSGARQVHLLTGGLTGHSTSVKAGNHGKIIIQGDTSLGNMYAGSLSADGQDNRFNLPSTIVIDPAASGKMGEVYASGALQSFVSDNWFDFEEPVPPTANADKFKVTGAVSIELYDNVVNRVWGQTGGTVNAAVAFTGGKYPNTSLKVDSISSLFVLNGMLTPVADSNFSNNVSISVQDGNQLNLLNFDNDLMIGDFTGGGTLVLGQSQTLTITGNVSGTTTIGIKEIFNGRTEVPTTDHTYIKASQSIGNSFILAPLKNYEEMNLSRDTSGHWSVPTTEEDPIIIKSIMMKDVTLPSDNTGVQMPLEVTYETNNFGFGLLSWVPLNIKVNNTPASRTEDEAIGYSYSTGEGASALTLEMIQNKDTGDDELLIRGSGGTGKIPVGLYDISVQVPEEYMESGSSYTFSAQLKVTDDTTTLQIPVPTANSGLKWTGQEQVGVSDGTGYTLTGNKGTEVNSYTADATLEPGYQWSDGTNEVKVIPWNISKTDGPFAPVGLKGVAPSSSNGVDGTITGTTIGMEYSYDSSFATKIDCGDLATTGLAAGTYYVRMKETSTHEAGAYAIITVPAYNAPTATSIAVNSTGHKTAYTVGDSLDVSGLTIEVTMSDSSKNIVNVTENMISGFDSSTAAASQTLTIHYEGKVTTYDISIAAPMIPPASVKHTVTVHDSYASVSGAGNYTVSDTVNISAGTRIGYAFDGWKASGVTLDNPNSVDTSFIMPAYAVTVTANWRSTSGDSIGSGSIGGGFIGGGSTGGTPNVTDESVNNEDGSTTTTTIDKITGTVTETTEHKDGSTSIVETKKNGTVTNTVKDKEGNTTVTVTKADGTLEIVTKQVDGHHAVTTINNNGQQNSTVTLSSTNINDANKHGVAVSLLIPKVNVNNSGETTSTVKIILPASNGETKVEIPVANPTPGTVAVLINPDGTEEIIKHSILAQGGLQVSLQGDTMLRIVDNSINFADTVDHWSADAVAFVTARNLFAGTSADSFTPNITTTRGMMAVLLARLAGHETTASTGEAWYVPGMKWAMENNISDGTNPEGYVSREQLVTMLWRYNGSPISEESIENFGDYDNVSEFAQIALSWAVKNSIITGKNGGILDPQGNATRAETAQIIMNYLNNI